MNEIEGLAESLPGALIEPALGGDFGYTVLSAHATISVSMGGVFDVLAFEVMALRSPGGG